MMKNLFKSQAKDKHSEIQTKKLPNDSVLSNSLDISTGDLSRSTILSSQIPDAQQNGFFKRVSDYFLLFIINIKSFFKLLGGIGLTSKHQNGSNQNRSSDDFTTNGTQAKPLGFSAKKYIEYDRYRVAKAILRELHAAKKEEIIMDMIRSKEIATDDQAMKFEDDIDREFYDDYGSEGKFFILLSQKMNDLRQH